MRKIDYYEGTREDRLSLVDVDVRVMFLEFHPKILGKADLFVCTGRGIDGPIWEPFAPTQSGAPRPTICDLVVYTDPHGIEHPAVVDGASPGALTCDLHAFVPTGAFLGSESQYAQNVRHADPSEPNTWRWPPKHG